MVISLSSHGLAGDTMSGSRKMRYGKMMGWSKRGVRTGQVRNLIGSSNQKSNARKNVDVVDANAR